MLVAAAPAFGKAEIPKDQLSGIHARAAPQSLTAPLGSTKGSFIDGSVIYGSDTVIPTGGSILPFIEQDN